MSPSPPLPRLLLLLSTLALFLQLAPLSARAASPSAALFPPSSGVLQLNSSSFQPLVHSPLAHVLVLFYSPKSGRFKELHPEYLKLPKSLNSMIHVAAVDCTVEEELCDSEEATEGLPIIKLYTGKGTPRRYSGPPQAKHLTSFSLFALPNLVTALSPANVDKRSSSLARVLLFTDKAETPALFRALAQRLQGQLDFGEVKAGQKKLLTRYALETTDLPRILIEHDGEVTTYEGAMSFPALLEALAQYAKAGGGEGAAVLDELVDQSCLRLYCVEGKASLCAVLVASGASPELAQHQRMFRTVSDTRSDPVFHHVWLDSDKHADFLLSAFGLYPADYPQLVVLSAKKDRYVVYMGALAPGDIGDWLRMITAGKIRTIPYETRDGKLPLLSDGDEEDACKPPPPPAPPAPKVDKYLHQLTGGNFETAVLDRKAAWMVLATTEAQAHAHMAPWLALVNRSKNAVRVGMVNTEKDPALKARLNVSTTPVVRYLRAGQDRGVWESYEGELNETALTAFSLTLLHSRFVQKVAGEAGLVSFMASYPDAPRILLFSKQKAAPPLLQSLSIDFHPHLIFGLANEADQVLTKKFNVKKAPAFMALGQLEKEGGGTGGPLELVAGSYEGGMAWEEVNQWLETVRREGVTNEGMPEDMKKRYRAARKKEEEKRVKAEAEEKKKRQKAEEEAEKKKAADAKADEGSCEVSADDGEGQCTAPPTSA